MNSLCCTCNQLNRKRIKLQPNTRLSFNKQNLKYCSLSWKYHLMDNNYIYCKHTHTHTHTHNTTQHTHITQHPHTPTHTHTHTHVHTHTHMCTHTHTHTHTYTCTHMHIYITQKYIMYAPVSSHLPPKYMHHNLLIINTLSNNNNKNYLSLTPPHMHPSTSHLMSYRKSTKF